MAPVCKSLKMTYLSASWFVWRFDFSITAFAFFNWFLMEKCMSGAGVPADARNVAYKRIIAA